MASPAAFTADAPLLPLHLRVLAPPRIIHWIDSKAMFGDPLTHKDNLENQLQGYTHRFGPGLVVYWFGFVDEIREWTPSDIMIASRLPDEWVVPGDNSSSGLSVLPSPLAAPSAASSSSSAAASASSSADASASSTAGSARSVSSITSVKTPPVIRTPQASKEGAAEEDAPFILRFENGAAVSAGASVKDSIANCAANATNAITAGLATEPFAVATMGGLSSSAVFRLYSACGLLHLLPLQGGGKLGKSKATQVLSMMQSSSSTVKSAGSV